MTEPTPQLGPGQNIPELVAAAAHVRAAPAEFQADDFEPLPIVVSILQAPAAEREARIREMHELCTVFDADVAAVSNAFWEGFNKSTKSYSRVLQIINESYDGCHSVQRTLADASFRPVDHATKESPASPFACARPQPHARGSSSDTLGTASTDKLGYLWGKSLELEYTIELVHKVQRLRDAVPAATEFMDAGYHLHAAAVIKQALEIVREIQGYGFFGTNSLCAAVQDVRLKLTSLLSRRLNDLVHGHRHEHGDTPQLQQAPFAAALASTTGDKEPFHLSFSLL